jgi:hypothetical protein
VAGAGVNPGGDGPRRLVHALILLVAVAEQVLAELQAIGGSPDVAASVSQARDAAARALEAGVPRTSRVDR